MTPAAAIAMQWALNLLAAGLTDYAAEVALPATGQHGATARALLASGDTPGAMRAIREAMCEAPADRDHWLALARQHDARAEVEVRAIQRSNRENQR